MVKSAETVKCLDQEVHRTQDSVKQISTVKHSCLQVKKDGATSRSQLNIPYKYRKFTPHFKEIVSASASNQLSAPNSEEFKCQMDTVLLSDSICQHLAHIWNVEVISYPGTVVDEMIQRVELNRLPFKCNPKIIIIHVGKNNLDFDTDREIANKILELATKLHDKLRVVIAVSLLIPRPDDVKYNTMTQGINALVKAKINTDFMHCFHTYKVFLKKGGINMDLFSKEGDKTDLNIDGNRRLFQYMSIRLSEMRKELGLAWHQYPPPPTQVIRKGDSDW